jgi:membrane protein DedA with SNARE-associated domain
MLVQKIRQATTLPFYVANCLSAVIWAPALLLSGFLLGRAASSGWDIEDKLFVVLLVLTAVIVVIYWARRIFRVR